jgi:hypothetical protein
MELLDSEWFYRMVEHQKNPPAERLVAVFTVIGNWISAPGVRDLFTAQHSELSTSRLKTYLIETAQSAKAHNPSMLATQLLILLQGAIAEELRNPGVNAIESAAKAAQAVVSNACQPSRQKRLAQWSAVATVMVGLSAALIWHALPQAPEQGTDSIVAMQRTPYLRSAGRMPMGVNPSEMEAILTLQEKFDRGICPAPHLLALPQGQMMAYMNVINFRTPENPESDRENLHAFLVWFNQAQASECYYAPSNGHTNVSWVKR